MLETINSWKIYTKGNSSEFVEAGVSCTCINNERLTKFELISMLDYYTERYVTFKFD